MIGLQAREAFPPRLTARRAAHGPETHVRTLARHGPGAMAFTADACSPSSMDSVLVNPISAHFVAE